MRFRAPLGASADPPTTRIHSFRQRTAQTAKRQSFAEMTLPNIVPRLIAFDLDATLWLVFTKRILR